MIVEPGFFNHPKTLAFLSLIEDDLAPIYVIKLWEYCQIHRQWEFERMTPYMLKSITGFKNDAQKLYDAMLEAGFIRKNDREAIVVHNWDRHNAGLIASWHNGRKGGRPKKTQTKPNENPWDNPWDNPQVNPRDNPDKTHGVTHGVTDVDVDVDVDKDIDVGEATASLWAPAPARERARAPDAADGPPPLPRKSNSCDAEWLEELKSNPAYEGIDVDREFAKMATWCQTNGKKPSRRRFVNWLNRTEKPMTNASGLNGRHQPRHRGMDEAIHVKTL